MADAIKTGDTISVDYTGKLEDGEVFDSSEGKQPLKFTVGAGMLIKGFDEAVIGMKPGDKKNVTIPPEQAYGPINEDSYIDIPKSQFPEEIPLQEGLMLELRDPNGRPVPAKIMEILEDSVRMDLNHALAGKTLEFDITIMETGLEPDPVNCGTGCDCGTTCGSGSTCDC